MNSDPKDTETCVSEPRDEKNVTRRGGSFIDVFDVDRGDYSVFIFFCSELTKSI